MPNPAIQQWLDEVTRAKGLDASVVAFMNGSAARQQAAIDAALANGATEAELQPIVDELVNFKASNDAVAEALAANPV